MKREEFVSMFSESRISETTKKGFRGKTWEVQVLRFDMGETFYSDMITITPTFTYIPNRYYFNIRAMKLSMEDFMEEFVENYTAEYTLKGDTMYPFNYSAYRVSKEVQSRKMMMERNNRYKTARIDTKPSVYVKALMLSDLDRMESTWRFRILASEKEVASKFLTDYSHISCNGKMINNLDELDETIEKTELFQISIINFTMEASMIAEGTSLKSLREALELSMEKKHMPEDEGTYTWERTSIIKILDQMLTSSVKSEVLVDKDVMNRLYNESRRQGKPSNFHNLLLFQIMDMMDFTCSDNLSVMIYNVIIKNFMPFTMIEPSSKLKKFNPDVKDKMTSMAKMVQLRTSDDRLDLADDMALFG